MYCLECGGDIIWAAPSVSHDGIAHPSGPEQTFCVKCKKFVIPAKEASKKYYDLTSFDPSIGR
jgi:hypothetical protein